ncbi:uncharacterized protein LOC128881164 [Hylaeus volcanicus]|uniref:uncharacterized protein LOC128881164 n=1 Tax=Hylaeus volcanicus TaxID=313075 RepID=UPI0023B77764|nr:uncharacterized protein LOC128881164 [Hylaeus volcanicus]
MFSKAICPSTGYAGPSTRKLSHSARTTYFSANNPACRKYSSRGNTEKGVFCGTTSRRRRFSSEDSSCNKTSTSDSRGDQTSGNQEAAKDRCSKRKPVASSCSSAPMEVCPESSTTCTLSVKDPCPKPCPPPVCPAPEESNRCSNVDDYCVTEASRKEKFYRFLSLFVAMPLILVMSIYVYAREMEKKKQPRPEFVDVPYMRRIIKPFPWGDGRHTLFHNPVKNPISPHGYEVEDPNAPKTGEPKD